ncbi:MAG: preprotein translocase subunit YajC [candidate division WOR-3 bacterium]|uniref:Preprotein translocase subunit YajC n=1 Tax=candidate division WOR-3 bacterium TaxID=2052148 RepID=A0A7V4EC40_UNCW3
MKEGNGNLLALLFPFIILFVFFYLFIILPQQRREKKHREMIKNLKKGDYVFTSSGIYGTVSKIDEKTVILKLSENVFVKFDKSAIQEVLKKEE